jgi:DNA mismatch repair protein MutS2
VDDLRADVRGARRRLERETVTAPALDEVVERAEARLGRFPAAAPAPPPPPQAAPVAWRVGARARSRTGGWEGRIVALERGGTRATLEVGGMRVTAPTVELEPAVASALDAPRASRPDGGASDAASGISRLRLERARTVASSLDVRGARVDEALEVVDRYLEDASLAGLERAIIIHGLGTGALRDAVRAAATAHPLVRSVRAGERGEGGDGATIVAL